MLQVKIAYLVAVLLATVTAGPFVSSATYSALNGYALVNASNSTLVQSNSAGACQFMCTARNCFAAQYNFTGWCTLVFSCATLVLLSASGSKVFIPSNYLLLSGIPQPMFEWMMTDTCGSVNTGWYNPGLPMLQTYNSVVNGWTATYNITIPNSNFGRAIWYPNMLNYYSMSPDSTIVFDYTKSITVFGYMWLYANAVSFPIIEFSRYFGQVGSNVVMSVMVWYDYGVLYYAMPVTCSGSCSTSYSVTLPLNLWLSVAFVYDATLKTWTAYYNGVVVASGGTLNLSQNLIAYYVATGSRGDRGQLPGTTFCLKLFQVALNSSAIASVAKSCFAPSVRFG